MKLTYRLLFGPLAGALFAIGVIGLALTMPGYSHVRQTVSEIGEIGSPARVPFAILLCAIAVCILIFAAAMRDLSVAAGRSRLTAYLSGCMAVSAAGVGLFAHPHPLHNVFAVSELIGYQAPLAFALAWRRDRRASTLVAFSWAAYLFILIAIPLNLTALDRQGIAWSWVAPAYGLAQRALFAAWFGWCALVGTVLARHQWREAPPPEAAG